ncbi:hypothetical protein Fmac_025382 [Flemingia macrophylla]|uniref:Uncharacterized protein n=1 Tax=Flemingia macrophylla TaxID=520843 RepID=A0ABD1LS45_9FABA
MEKRLKNNNFSIKNPKSTLSAQDRIIVKKDQETTELHHPQPQPPQQQQPEPTPQDPNAMSLDEPAQEEQHQQQDPEEEVEDEDEEDDLQKLETLEEDQPHTLEAANHDAEANVAEEEEENEDPNLNFWEVR